MIEFHEAADIFPLDEENIGELAKDIRANGQLVPIEVMDGKILDGRRRYRACRLAGLEPKVRDVKPSDPVAYVLSLNLHRRHLNPSQWAMVGARAEKLMEKLAAEAKERMKRKPAGSAPANLPEQTKGDTRDKIGELVGVSGKSIDHAKKVLKNGVPELIKAVDEGKLAVSNAAIIASEPPEVQKHEAEFRPDGKRRGAATQHARPATQERDDEASDGAHETSERKVLGKGVILAHEAINCLTRIPKNDALRKQGFRLVTDWIKRNP